MKETMTKAAEAAENEEDGIVNNKSLITKEWMRMHREYAEYHKRIPSETAIVLFERITELETRLRKLVKALGLCPQYGLACNPRDTPLNDGVCNQLATHGPPPLRFCAKHTHGYPELPWAAALREAQKALGDGNE